MVFCGKASLNCKNCRTRRIKCSKQEPECSQCIRVGKKCPGYRDQLSLMFRDKTVKVRKKFEDGSGDSTFDGDAGEPLPPDDTSDSAVSESSTLATKDSSHNRSGGQGRKDETDTEILSPETSQRLGEVLKAFADNLVAARVGTSAKPDMDIRSKKQVRQRSKVSSSLALPRGNGSTTYENTMAATQVATVQAMRHGPGQTPMEQGLHFSLEHYLYGHPESPPKGGDVAVHIPWVLDPSARLIASAVGLAGLGNLAGNDQTRITSWQNYLTGLQMTAQTLKTPGLDTLNNAMRCVVLMAMYEIVRGTDKASGNASVHVMGAAALHHHFLPHLPKWLHPYRGLLQLCFSLLIPCIVSKSYVPPIIAEYMTSTYREKPKDDHIMAALLLLLYELANLLVYVQSQALTDTRPDIVGVVVQALHLESGFVVPCLPASVVTRRPATHGDMGLLA